MTERRADWATSPLLTDLYQLTMLQSYFDGGMHDEAVFELFFRRLPPTRNFLVVAGLEQLVDYLRNLSFGPAELDALADAGLFHDRFLAYLERFEFTGDVDAIPEGTVCFQGEPVVRVTAPLPEAQLIETRLLNLVHFETLIASKAARFVLAAKGATLVDFGMRRAHGAEAAVLAARASYIAGFAGTATVIARPLFGIPIFGTMAHSYIQAHDSEVGAFERFARGHRGPVVLLIDTYDTEAAARQVVDLAARLRADGLAIHSVRIDSGDLEALSRSVRRILDAAPGGRIGIFVSGGLTELDVAGFVARQAPIDGYGIGTALDASTDAPALDCAYKLQEYAGRPRRKRSPGKETLPGRKQVYRRRGPDGRIERDVVTLVSEPRDGEPLLVPVLRRGQLVADLPDLDRIRAHCAAELAALPTDLKALDRHVTFEVDVDRCVTRLAERS